MATVTDKKVKEDIRYPTSDGKPMAETDHHRDLMLDLIKALQVYFAALPLIYVSGNLLVFYERGNRRRHLSPDVFVVRGVPKRQRLNYLIWEEGRGPGVVIELTYSSTRREDTRGKYLLYQNVLRVPEYFLFDPFGDYLRPALQGYRLRKGAYAPIRPLRGRLPSRVLGLHLEQDGSLLRLFDPVTGSRLLTPDEHIREVEAENERLRREIVELRRGRDQQ
jgi:Uma2 family endonuclease